MSEEQAQAYYCWYCKKMDMNMVFSMELDSYVHLACVRERVEKLLEEHDFELAVFVRELELLR